MVNNVRESLCRNGNYAKWKGLELLSLISNECYFVQVRMSFVRVSGIILWHMPCKVFAPVWFVYFVGFFPPIRKGKTRLRRAHVMFQHRNCSSICLNSVCLTDCTAGGNMAGLMQIDIDINVKSFCGKVGSATANVADRCNILSWICTNVYRQ